MIINLSDSFKLIGDAANAYNNGKPLKEKLRSTHINLMRMLVSLYAMQMNKMVRTTINYKALPMLYTNNVQLAGLLHCDQRTIQRYINRLEGGCNFIQDKIFHGSNSSYELRLNPTLFQLVELPKPAFPEPPKNVIPVVSMSTCRHTESGYLNNSIKNVDQKKSISLETTGDLPATRVSNPPQNGSSNPDDNLLGGAGVLDSEPTELAPASLTSLTTIIQSCWNFLYVKWYVGKVKFMSDAQALHAWNYFYAQFISLPEKEWNSLWREHLIRIQQVATYQEKNSERYVPLPSVMFTGKRLYDRTRAWYLKSKQTQVDLDKWKQDHQLAIHEMKVFKTVLRDYFKQPTVFSFRKAEQRLSKHSKPALQEFYKVVLTAHNA